MTGHVSRLQVLAIIPAVLAGQTALPTTGAELAEAGRSTWAAGLAAACDSMPTDSTWRTYRLPRSEITIRLPHTLVERGEILGDVWYDHFPTVPERDYAVQRLDPLTIRLLVAHATLVFRCPTRDLRGIASLPDIGVLGFDLGGRDAPAKGVWNVIVTWPTHEESLLAMSTTLWGARAFVTGMQLADVPRHQATPP